MTCSALAQAALDGHDPEAARVHAERAVSIREAGETSPSLLAKARLVLARALWPDPAQRGRARALAEQARDAYVELGEGMEDGAAEARAWLAEHPAP